jgi:hypothetical protein
VLAWILAVGLSSVPSTPPGLKRFAETAEDFSKIFAVVATIWGGILAANRSLLFGAAHAAQSYAELTNDPTSEIKRRFAGLVEKLRPARVAVLIDDLDRCQSRYVVDLLEGVQTLFREAPVVFVVAADRHWLNACYEEVYEKLQPRIYEPGKPLGTLFLEKAFRFSTPMPGLPDDLRKEYWEYLLQLAPKEHGAEAAAARDKARNEVANTGSEGAVLNLVDNSRQRPFLEQRALREEAAIRLAAPEILRRLEHTLKPYGQLLEPNPRAMKLLVNSYSANRALAILSELDIETHQLALWTVLSTRWPQLADYLVGHPEMVDTISQPEIAGLPDWLNALRAETSVRQVIKGDANRPPLSMKTLRQCAQIWSS